MILIAGLSQYNIALFHLVNHAFFKALLFLAAGSVIHAMQDEQDMRKMGGLSYLMPFTYTMMLIGSLSLMALPFLDGFYSKDQIIETAFGQYQFSGLLSFCLLTISSIFTALYSIRLLFLVFLGYPNGSKNQYINAHESPALMAIPLGILAIFSIFFGYIANDLFIGVGTPFWGNALFVHPDRSLMVDVHFGVPTGIKLLPLFGVILGATSFFVMYALFPMILVNMKLNSLGRTLYRFFNQKFFFDNIYNNFIITPALISGYIFHKLLDKGALELIGPLGLQQAFTNMSKKLVSLDTYSIPHVALYIIVNLCVLIVIILGALDPRYLILYLIALYLV